MTRKQYLFEKNGMTIISPEFNGDRNEFIQAGSLDSCDKAWAEIEYELCECNSIEDFLAACDRIQMYYHSSVNPDIEFETCLITLNNQVLEKYPDAIRISDIRKARTARKYRYVASLEIPEIFGSGSMTSREVYTYDEEKAFRLLKDRRNTLRRFKRRCGLYSEYWDAANGTWRSYKKTTEPIRLV